MYRCELVQVKDSPKYFVRSEFGIVLEAYTMALVWRMTKSL